MLSESDSHCAVASVMLLASDPYCELRSGMKSASNRSCAPELASYQGLIVSVL
jgi:hypothetical protein